MNSHIKHALFVYCDIKCTNDISVKQRGRVLSNRVSYCCLFGSGQRNGWRAYIEKALIID